MSRNRETLTVSHKQIFEYWKDKAISDEGNVYIDLGYEGCDEHLLGKAKTETVIIDWGEPRCWACNGVAAPLEVFDKYDFWDDPGRFWNTREAKKTLQRCHIVPHSLGGSDEPKNLFLLCERCHKLSPDTSYPKQFLKWVYQRRKWAYNGKCFGVARDILKNDYGINLPKFTTDDFSEIEKHITTHGGVIQESSLVAAYIGVALENEKKYIEACY